MQPKVQTFVSEAHAPLSAKQRSALTALFQMRWPEVAPELSPEELTAYRRICLPESRDFILDHPDYYAFYTYSMFHGKVKMDGH